MFFRITWKSAGRFHFPLQIAVGSQFPENWLIHFIVVCVTKASVTGNLNFETDTFL